MKRKEKMEMARKRKRQNAYPERSPYLMIYLFQQQGTCRICETDAYWKITDRLSNSR
jgi:hypothetical protein